MENPYRSPKTESQIEYAFPPAGESVCETSRWLYRKILVGPPYEVCIEWNAREMGYDLVRVNGSVARRRVAWLWFVNHFWFDIPHAGDFLPAKLEVVVSHWLKVRSMRLEINGQVVWSEGLGGAPRS